MLEKHGNLAVPAAILLLLGVSTYYLQFYLLFTGECSHLCGEHLFKQRLSLQERFISVNLFFCMQRGCHLVDQESPVQMAGVLLVAPALNS